jgi:hypothetical protein
MKNMDGDYLMRRILGHRKEQGMSGGNYIMRSIIASTFS